MFEGEYRADTCAFSKQRHYASSPLYEEKSQKGIWKDRVAGYGGGQGTAFYVQWKSQKVGKLAGVMEALEDIGGILMLQDTIKITEEIRKAELGEVTITYYTMGGKDKTLSMCPGDLYVICNVLYDYANLISELLENEPVPEGCTDYVYHYHINRCKRIQEYIEKSMEYSTEKAIAKCRKKQGRKSDDIGEDALVQMVKAKRKRQELEEREARERNKNK